MRSKLTLTGVGIWLFVFAVPTFCVAFERHVEDTRPNIIVFLVDDWGVMDTSVPLLCNKDGVPEKQPLNLEYRTSNLERLARQGARFSNFYAMSVCSPTRVSLMTGQTSARHRTTNWIDPENNNAGKFGPKDWNWRGLSDGRTNLARLLQGVGYRTIHCGKGHFGPFDSEGSDPTKIGFDINIGGSGAGQPGSYYGLKNFGNNPGPRVRWGVPSLEKFHGEEVFLTEALTQEFNQALSDSVKDGKPFFGYFAHYAVHSPFQSDPRFAKNYEGQPKDLAAFCSLVEGVDKSLGDVLEHLEKLGVADNTLIFFLGDNGTDSPRGDQYAISCAAPLRGKKGTQYEGGMRVPFFASWAARKENSAQKRLPIKPDNVRQEVGAVYDLMPTILAATEINAKKELVDDWDGIDLWPILSGNDVKKSESRDFLMHYPHEHRSSYFTVFRRENWKLVYHYKKAADNRFELYDLASDPSESNNVATTNRDQLETIFDAMVEALEKTNAQFPIDDKGISLRPSL